MAVASAYPTYRPSGLPWIGKIPEHWEVRRISTLGRVGNGSTPSRSNLAYWSDAGLPWLNSGVVHQGIVKNPPRWVTQTAVRECHLPIVPKGSVVLAITGQGKTRGTPALLGIDAAISQHLAYISIRDHVISGAYLRFALTAGYGMLRAISDDTGGTKGALTCSAVKRFSVALPPRPEQDQIVAYLRAQDAHIARFIKAKRDLIKLLTEQKLRIIDHAVTRGLDASVTLKPSGIEWLGEVPEHWDISRLGTCIRTNRAGVWGSDPSDKNLPDQLICVRVTDFDMEQLSVGTSKLTVRAVTKNERSGRLLCSGDILLEKSGGGEKTSVGRVVAFTLDKVSVCSNFLARLVPNTQIVRSAFLLTLMNHLHARRIVIPYIKQTTGIQNLDSTAYFKLGIALPSLKDQDKILQALAEQCKPIEEAIQRASEEIKLIREYRDRLIADVVTGQVDVRGWQPGPDDVVDDAALAALGDDPDDVTEMEVDDGGE